MPCQQNQLYRTAQTRCKTCSPKYYSIKGSGQLCAALFSLPSVVMGATDFNTDHNCSRTMNPNTALGSSTDPDITVALGTTHLSPLLTTFISSVLPLYPGHGPFSSLFLPYATIQLLTITVSNYSGQSHVLSFPLKAGCPRQIHGSSAPS